MFVNNNKEVYLIDNKTGVQSCAPVQIMFKSKNFIVRSQRTALKREKRGKRRALMVLHNITNILFAKKAPFTDGAFLPSVKNYFTTNTLILF